ncbi:hypothetical protein [Prosthecobacter dejongeii]|uniref:Uncharacterized protein n=1 Tax=Prosthecobacter dejongeii TaxID=48465 RepID=A0A7W7YNU3_9BACT|nr:hypothetical protein [Prosthecobacter dejongeii]MBB5039616.1 hypothetical protein [Prosthecobacter dejongeii]
MRSKTPIFPLPNGAPSGTTKGGSLGRNESQSTSFLGRWSFGMGRWAKWACLLTVGPLWAVQGAMELIARETFEGVKTLNAENVGQLGTWIRGAWHCRPIGPRVEGTPAPGWSGRTKKEMVEFRWDLTQAPYSQAQQGGLVGCWVRFEDLLSAGYFNEGSGVANPAQILQLNCRQDNNPFQMIGVTQSGQLLCRKAGVWHAGGNVEKHTWYWLQIEWLDTETGFAAKASFQKLGGELQELSTESIVLADHPARYAMVMNAPFQTAPFQNYIWGGRLGGATLAKISTLGEGRQLPDLLQPVEERHTWYLNPLTGNDDHDGLSPEKAWKTVAKFNEESLCHGLLSPKNGGYAQGDTVSVDTSGAPLLLKAESWRIHTPGLSIVPAAGQQRIQIQAHGDISAPGARWERVDGFPNVWTTTDANADDLAHVVVWEDDRWLHHPTGEQASAVMAALNQVPGSFYSDGTALYLHPFGSTNPNVDGKTYTRSRFRPGGASAVMLVAPDLYIEGLEICKTTLAEASTNLPFTAYGIQGDEGFGGLTVLKHCTVSYAGKHCIGFTDSNSGRQVTVEDCQVEQGTPYANQSPWVDYNGLPTASGNKTIYKNCLNLKPMGKIGSTEGATQETTSYLLHNNGSGTQFAEIEFIGGIYGGQISTYVGVTSLKLTGTTFGGGVSGAQTTSVTRCVMTQLPMGNSAPDGVLIARHNLGLFSDGVFNSSFNASCQGTLIYEGNTFDLRPFQRSDNASFSLFQRVAPVNFVFRNNVFITPADQFFSVIEKAQATDALTFSHNVYHRGQTGAAARVVSLYNDGLTTAGRSLTEWQALGQDTEGLGQDAKLDAFYMPTLDSPAVRSGANLGEAPDFTGRHFWARRSRGAVEPAESFSDWQSRHFTLAELGQTAVSGPQADDDQDGISNLVEFAFGYDPRVFEKAFHQKIHVTYSGQEKQVSLEFRKPAYALGVSYIPEMSLDMTAWEIWPNNLLPSVESRSLDGMISFTFDQSLPEIHADRLFFRLRVDLLESSLEDE